MIKLQKMTFLRMKIKNATDYLRWIHILSTILLISYNNIVSGQVKAYQEPLILPTYAIEKPEIMPDWRKYRYPYVMFDRLTNKKGVRTYNALFVENEYVKALILPELGGRLHAATDKTNGYNFLYDQKVIKPGLISTTGAWISGGVEWNFPIGHRPSGFRDVDWSLQKNQDGSETAWTGEIDRMTGMRWSVGTTVHPGRNWVETKVRLYNCTPYVHRFQYWATSGVRATPNYQAVIPGEIMTGHGKHEFYNWPVHNGVNISYWKNIPAAGSYFVVDSESDFFGGYSPEENAGIVHFANHHVVRGKKLWTWGTAPAGRLWEKILTDGDLPYFEPQAGAYSDNQPSLFWIMPGETKIFSHFWFPVRDIGVYDYANLEGALNIDFEDDKVTFGWSPTGINNDAVVVLTNNEKEVFIKRVNADPANPFLGELNVSPETSLYDLKMTVLSSTGDTLLNFCHSKREDSPLPEPEPAPLPPDHVKSQDVLYVIANRLNKYNEVDRALKYYSEILRRDSGDVRTNTDLGEIALKSGKYEEAIHYFDTSLSRDEDFFRAWYFKGIAQLHLSDDGAAVRSLNRAAYNQSWYAPAHFELAQLALKQGQPEEALRYIERSIAENGDNTEAYAVKALILLKFEKFSEASQIINENLSLDPLNHFLLGVKAKLLKESDSSQEDIDEVNERLSELLRNDSENYIDLAIRFARCGNYIDATDILDKLIRMENTSLTPLVYYYKAYYEHLLDKDRDDLSDLQIASKINPIYCFPNRLESFSVLKWALKQNANDPNAHHLLAMLLYSRSRKEEAVNHWENAVKINPENSVAYRNLGLVYREQNNMQKARQAYLAGLKANPEAGKIIVELGQINNELNLPYEEQIGFFEKNISVAETYNPAVSQLVELYVIAGRYKEALCYLQKTHFNSWEGKYGIHQLWVQSNIKMGDEEMKNKNYEEALKYYKQSLEYPFNLEVAEQPNTIHARKYFKIAQALETLGRKKEAKTYYKKITTYSMDDGNAYQFFTGCALEALGQKEKAKEIYKKMLAASDGYELTGQNNNDPMIAEQPLTKGNAVNLFTRSLALEGLNRLSESQKLREEAFKQYQLVELSAFAPPRSGY